MSDKYMKEIEDILKRAEEVMPKGEAQPPRGQSGGFGRFFGLVSRPSGGRGLKISATKLMLISFALLLLALILGAFKVISVVPLVVAGLLLFVIAYGLFFIRPGTDTSYEKRWRGRLIEERTPFWDRVRRWLRS